MSDTNNNLSLEISKMFDGHVLATTLVPAFLQQGYDAAHLRREALADMSVQPSANVEELLSMFDREVERFFLSQVTAAEMEATTQLITVIGVTPECKKGEPVEYTPSESKGFSHTPSVMDGTRALRMMGYDLPEAIRTYLKTFI